MNKTNIRKVFKYWKTKLGLDDYTIYLIFESDYEKMTMIHKETDGQVTADCSTVESTETGSRFSIIRFFIPNNSYAENPEQTIVHELLHAKYPLDTEEMIIIKTSKIMRGEL